MLNTHNILNGIWMIERSTADNYLPYITQYIKAPFQVDSQKRVAPIMGSVYNEEGETSFAFDSFISSLKDAPKGSIATIYINGAMTKHDQFCGPDGMLTKAKALRAAYEFDNIDGVVLKIDSGGGEGFAMLQMIEAIQERNKPTVAFIDDMAASAAYGIASACDHIVANNPMAMVGSIGTYITFADYEEYYAQQGIKLTDVYASASTHKNIEHREALKGNLKPLRERANEFNSHFLDTVSQNRGDKLTDDSWQTGRTFTAQQALSIGLIDEINTFSNTLNSFVHE